MAVQGEKNRARARVVTGEQEGGDQDDEEGATGQSLVPDELRPDASVHGFWKWGTTALFDMQIVNLDVGSYLCQTSAKALTTAGKEKKYKYLQPCQGCRRSFTLMVYSADRIPGTEAVLAQQCLASLLSNDLKREYL